MNAHKRRTESVKTEEFERLGNIFHARLQSERIHFATLSAALARAEDSPNVIFDDLHFRAHRLKGAAAIFEFSDVAQAAGTLERAAAAASAAHAANTDSAVWNALVELVGLLGEFDEGATLPAELKLPEFAA